MLIIVLSELIKDSIEFSILNCMVSFICSYILWKKSEYFNSRINLHWINLGWTITLDIWLLQTVIRNGFSKGVKEFCIL